METKVCTKCGGRKSLGEFDPAASGKPQSWCRGCKRADSRRRSKVYAKRKSEVLRNRKQAWAKYGDVLELMRKRAYTEPSLVKTREERELGFQKAKAVRKRKERLGLATPSWLTEDQMLEIDRFYSHARDCKAVSGETYHVDHIVPIQGKNVCGLHVPWNLQVIPKDLNLRKKNTFDGGW